MCGYCAEGAAWVLPRNDEQGTSCTRSFFVAKPAFWFAKEKQDYGKLSAIRSQYAALFSPGNVGQARNMCTDQEVRRLGLAFSIFSLYRHPGKLLQAVKGPNGPFLWTNTPRLQDGHTFSSVGIPFTSLI
jgi:hypothetical protein